jgi:hypothetical protein
VSDFYAPPSPSLHMAPLEGKARSYAERGSPTGPAFRHILAELDQARAALTAAEAEIDRLRPLADLAAAHAEIRRLRTPKDTL